MIKIEKPRKFPKFPKTYFEEPGNFPKKDPKNLPPQPTENF